jgi:hypothetical protein
MNKADRQPADGTSGCTAPSPKPTYEKLLFQACKPPRSRRELGLKGQTAESGSC